MADSLVQKIIKAYADIGGLTSDECKWLVHDENQANALCETFADGFVNENEGEKLTSLGFSSQFITDLNSGSNALQQRVKKLADTGLKDQIWSNRSKTASVLGSMGPAAKPAIPALITALKDPDDNVSLNAAAALGNIGPAAVPALITALKDPIANVRRNAAYALGIIGPATKDVIPALITALKDPDNKVRFSAASALWKIGPGAKDAVPALIEMLKDPDLRIRKKVVDALGEIGPAAKDAVPALIAKFKDPHPAVPGEAAWALVRIGPAAIPALIETLKDPDQKVRNYAAEALAGMGTKAKAAIPALLEALKNYSDPDKSDGSYSRENSIAKAIRNIGPKAAKDSDLFNAAFKKADIDAAEKSIGAQGALLLWEKFGIERFNRYHPSILTHLVKMASDKNHDRHKPLILALVASYDDSDVFYWGKRFKYDPRIRLVVIEASNRKDFKDLAWQMRNTYDIPDVVFITAHGDWDKIKLGDTWLTNGEIAEDFKGFFGDKKGQVVLNTCDAGAPPPQGKKDFAQMTADGFGVETVAARAVEGLMELHVKITDEGQARLVPTYFELGAEFFGINHGGMKFYPHQKPMYERVADVNDSWQPGIALNIADEEWHVGASFGYSHQLSHRLRFRYDLLTDVGMNDYMGSRILFSPEIAVGLSNHLMFATGAMGGVEFDLDGSEQTLAQPVIQQYSAFKLVLPAANTELDLGYVNTVDPDDGIRPSFFSRVQGRFDISETSSR